MEFKMQSSVDTGRGVRIQVEDETSLTLKVGRVTTHAGVVRLTLSEALVVAGALRAMAEQLGK